MGLWNEPLDWCTGCCCLVSCHLCGCTGRCLMVKWGKQLGRWGGYKQRRERLSYNLPGPLHLPITISDGENLKLTTATSFASTKFHSVSLLANSTLRTYRVLVLENMISILTKLTLVKSNILPNFILLRLPVIYPKQYASQSFNELLIIVAEIWGGDSWCMSSKTTN